MQTFYRKASSEGILASQLIVSSTCDSTPIVCTRGDELRPKVDNIRMPLDHGLEVVPVIYELSNFRCITITWIVKICQTRCRMEWLGLYNPQSLSSLAEIAYENQRLTVVTQRHVLPAWRTATKPYLQSTRLHRTYVRVTPLLPLLFVSKDSALSGFTLRL